MVSFAEPRFERPAWTEPARRYPWLAASVAAHMLLAAVLYTAGPVRVEIKRDDRLRTQVNESLQQTGRREMQRQLRAMEEIKDALEQSAGGAPKGQGGKDGAKAAARDPEEKARQLAAAIEAVQQKIRATEMTRLLRIPEPEALKRVQAEEARRPKPPPPKGQPPEAMGARLAAQAKAALAQRRAQLLAQQQGVKLNPGGGKSGDGPLGDARSSGTNGGGLSGGAGADSAALGGRLDALTSGLGMGNPLALRGSSLDMSSEGFSDRRRYGAFVAPPPVDANAVRAGAGRKLGPGGPFANRIFLDTWYVIGPF
ncbi:hypothetical protein ACI48D_05675, partial [Massilia sp. LXY-6]